MTTERRFEQDLPDLLADRYLGPTPSYRDELLAHTGRMRQRARWTFPGRWLPMSVLTRTQAVTPILPRRLLVVALLALLMAALVVAYVGSQPRYPPPFGLARNGQIVYSRDGDIYVRDTAVAPPRLLIGGNAQDDAPWFSRRGDRFIFVRLVSTTGEGASLVTFYDLYVADADGSDVRRLGGPFEDIETREVSPDGTTALISSKGESGRLEVSLIPLDGGPSRTLPVEMSATWVQFRPPDGAWISFRGGDPGRSGDMYLIRPDGTGLHKLDLEILHVGGEHDFTHGMAWSDDGTQFAFTSIEDDLPDAGVDAGLRIDIATIGANGQVLDQRRLEFDPTADNELNPAFLPNSDRLLFQTREGIVDFIAVGVPGVRGRTIIKPGTTTEAGIDYVISPDGTKAYALDWERQKTYEYDLVTLQSRQVELGPMDMSSQQRLAP